MGWMRKYDGAILPCRAHHGNTTDPVRYIHGTGECACHCTNVYDHPSIHARKRVRSHTIALTCVQPQARSISHEWVHYISPCGRERSLRQSNVLRKTGIQVDVHASKRPSTSTFVKELTPQSSSYHGTSVRVHMFPRKHMPFSTGVRVRTRPCSQYTWADARQSGHARAQRCKCLGGLNTHAY